MAAGLTILIAFGTTNAFVAGVSRLGYALGREGHFPAWFAGLSPSGVPVRSVLAIGFYAGAGMALAYTLGWGPEPFLAVPNSLGIATYLIGTAAGVRLLAGRDRLLAALACGLCTLVLPFAGASLGVVAAAAAGALTYRRWRRGGVPPSTARTA